MRSSASLGSIRIAEDALGRPEDAALAADMLSKGYILMDATDHQRMATVYRVRSIRFDRVFSAKVLMSRDINKTTSVELAVIQRLSHTHIIQLYDVFAANSCLVLIYELCDGGSLMAELQEPRNLDGLPRARVVEIARQLISALLVCHEQGIAHRNVQPEAVMWRDAQRTCLRLSDFGMACIEYREENEGMGEPGASGVWGGVNWQCSLGKWRYGSQAFCAPELTSGCEDVDTLACDVWALGMTLMELLLGRELWAKKGQRERMEMVHEEIHRLAKEDPELGGALKRMVCGPERRATMAQLAALPVFQRRPPPPPARGVRPCGSSDGPGALALRPHETVCSILARKGKDTCRPIRTMRRMSDLHNPAMLQRCHTTPSPADLL